MALHGRVLITGGSVRDEETGRFLKTRTVAWTPETWDDGWVDVKGYFHVYRPDYPNTNDSGWAFRYHIVWWLQTGEVIRHPYVIHHKDETKDNDCFDNLEKMYSGDHTAMHSRKPGVVCICQYCGVEFTIPLWRFREGRGKFCSHECSSLQPQSPEFIRFRAQRIREAYSRRSNNHA